MSLTLLFAAGSENFACYQVALHKALAAQGIAAEITTNAPPETVDYIIYAPGSVVTDFGPFTRCKAVLSLWAGVERIVGNPTLTQPLCRMVDRALEQGMVEYVTGHVLRYHLGMDRHIVGPPVWDPQVPPLAGERPVGVLGMGALGSACALALARLGFPVLGWTRSARQLPDPVMAHHGPEGLVAVLGRAEILVTLLPLTPWTENVINARALGMMPRGAVLINPGRGALIDDAALLDALDRAHLAHATLDVFRTEPLPADHRFWTHPRVTVTPHVAAATRPETAAQVVAENIRRGESGAPFLHRVDTRRGY